MYNVYATVKRLKELPSATTLSSGRAQVYNTIHLGVLTSEPVFFNHWALFFFSRNYEESSLFDKTFVFEGGCGT